MTTETREYTAQELQAFGAAGKQLSENGFDVWTDGKEHNMALLNEYFQTNGNVPVTAANIFKAVEARKTEFRWVSPSEFCFSRFHGKKNICSRQDRKSTRLNSSHQIISYAVFCLKKKNNKQINENVK